MRINKNFNVKGQHITCTDDTRIIKGNKNLYYAVFHVDELWDDIDAKACFTVDEEPYIMPLNRVGNTLECEIPYPANSGIVFGVGIFGGDLISTDIVYTSTTPGIPIDGANPPEPVPDWFNKMEDVARQAMETANSVKEQADSGAFKGNPGYTPQKGLDYFTDEEVAEIVNKAAEAAGRTEETDPTVPAWAKAANKPTYTADEVGARPSTWLPSASEVGADPVGTAAGAVSGHNTAEDAHSDIRLLVAGLTARLNALADSDDTTLNQLSELVAYIKANRELIEQVTTGKVSVSDIVDNLTTNVSNKPLSAAQGVVLKGLIDAMQTAVNSAAKATDLTSHTGNTTVHITADERTKWNQAVTDVGNLSEEIVNLKGGTIPDYWQTHLDEKIASIKALQDAGGKDCFSFVVITDMHACVHTNEAYNWQPKSPILARYIMDKCDIKYILCLGDTDSRGCWENKENLMNDHEYINGEMFAPVMGRLLRTQGNHDGNYGKLDRDGNGVIGNYNEDGTLKPFSERETYVYSLTPAEMYNYIYRKVGLVGDVHFDKSGTGYYIYDVSNDVLYIMLNTHNTKYELNEDGTAKYSPMWTFRFQQSQYDMVIEALNSIKSDSCAVVIVGHVPFDKSGEVEAWGGTNDTDSDCGLMKRMLTAYKNKEVFSGVFEGTADGEGGGLVAGFTNKADTSDSDFLDGQYMNVSNNAVSGFGENTTYATTNYIPAVCPNKVADIARMQGFDVTQGIRYACYDVNKNVLLAGVSTSHAALFTTDENGVTRWAVGNAEDYISTSNANAMAFVRFSGVKTGTAEDIIVTINEEITYTESGGGGNGYDYVSVNADFTNAKGNIVGYFSGHKHIDEDYNDGIKIVITRCDGFQQENTEALRNERVKGTDTEYSFDVFTVNKATNKIYATKIGAGADREISY